MWGIHDGFGFGWWMLFGGIWMLIFWGVVIGLVIWGISKFSRRTGADETPLEIARKRLARGEITREEFEELREALR